MSLAQVMADGRWPGLPALDLDHDPEFKRQAELGEKGCVTGASLPSGAITYKLQVN